MAQDCHRPWEKMYLQRMGTAALAKKDVRGCCNGLQRSAGRGHGTEGRLGCGTHGIGDAWSGEPADGGISWKR